MTTNENFPMAKTRRIDWDAQPLGKLSDPELAKKLGVTPSAVCRARQRRGISAKFVSIDWDAQPLGKLSDPELAKKLGVTPPAVRKARLRRGIPSFIFRRAAARSDSDWAEQPLGKITDSELARRLGITRGTVRRAREKRGIPPLTTRGDPKNRYAINWDTITTLGKHPDAVIARRLGTSEGAVGMARKSRGIELSSVAIKMAQEARTKAAGRSRNFFDEDPWKKSLNALSGLEDECVCCPCCYEVPCLGASGCGLEEDPVCEEKQCRKVEK